MALSNLPQKREENKSQKCKSKDDEQKKKPMCEVTKKKPKCAKEGYAKRGAVKVSRRTWFLVVRVPQNQEKNFPKDEKVKKGDFCLKHLFQETFWQNNILKCRTRPSSTDWVSKLQWTIALIPKIVPIRARGKNTWKYFQIEEFTLLGHPFIILSILEGPLF